MKVFRWTLLIAILLFFVWPSAPQANGDHGPGGGGACATGR